MGDLAASHQRSVTVLPSEEHDTHGEALQRVQAEYRALPGLSLTGRQARRPFALQPTHGERALHTFVRTHFLAPTREGTFIRVEM